MVSEPHLVFLRKILLGMHSTSTNIFLQRPISFVQALAILVVYRKMLTKHISCMYLIAEAVPPTVGLLRGRDPGSGSAQESRRIHEVRHE